VRAGESVGSHAHRIEEKPLCYENRESGRRKSLRPKRTGEMQERWVKGDVENARKGRNRKEGGGEEGDSLKKMIKGRR